MLASAAAIILGGAIFIFVRRHHALPVARTLEAAPAVSVPVTPPPVSELSVVRLSSDTGTGKVTFDDQSPAEFQDGQWVLDKIPTGEHKLKFEGPRGEASFTFSTAAPTTQLI